MEFSFKKHFNCFSYVIYIHAGVMMWRLKTTTANTVRPIQYGQYKTKHKTYPTRKSQIRASKTSKYFNHSRMQTHHSRSKWQFHCKGQQRNESNANYYIQSQSHSQCQSSNIIWKSCRFEWSLENKPRRKKFSTICEKRMRIKIAHMSQKDAAVISISPSDQTCETGEKALNRENRNCRTRFKAIYLYIF